LNFSLPPRNPIRGCSSKYERRDVPQGQFDLIEFASAPANAADRHCWGVARDVALDPGGTTDAEEQARVRARISMIHNPDNPAAAGATSRG
jgi:hypothetical protein